MLGFSWLPDPEPFDESSPAGREPARIEVYSDSAADLELADWALGRFDIAGLELPDLTITFHTDKTGCKGYTGLFRRGRPHEVHMCVSEKSPPIVGKLNTLHELAHAWAETQTDDETRAGFLAEREIGSWIDTDEPKHLWGAEHAAETVSWALMDEPVRIGRIFDAEPERLATAFRLLTGSEPLVPWLV
jgi:hypothetical protein